MKNGNFKQSASSQPAPGEDFGVSVFPQPAHQELTIEVDPVIGAKRVQLFDLTGRMLEQVEIPNDPAVRIDIRDFASGSYFYRLETNSGTRSGRIQVQH